MPRYDFDYSNSSPIVRFVVGLLVMAVTIAVVTLLLPVILGVGVVILVAVAILWAWVWYKAKEFQKNAEHADFYEGTTDGSNGGYTVKRVLVQINDDGVHYHETRTTQTVDEAGNTTTHVERLSDVNGEKTVEQSTSSTSARGAAEPTQTLEGTPTRQHRGEADDVEDIEVIEEVKPKADPKKDA